MTIKPFLNNQFLLQNGVAEKLYHEFAKSMPIIDFHSHVVPEDIASDRKFKTITELWLENDSTKWRAMRAYGINEKYLTGDASDFEKFEKWAETTPFTIRNPLYHWNHLELQRYFSISKLLNPSSAKEIYNETTSLLQTPEFSARSLVHKMNVEVAVTTDDPIDSLEHHKTVAKDNLSFQLLPTFRPDNAIHIEKHTFSSYINSLSQVVNTTIDSFDELLDALKNRADYFEVNGCVIADHGLEHCYASNIDYKKANEVFKKSLQNKHVSVEERETYKSTLLFELGKLYAKKSWTMQLHLGAMRNNNSRLEKLLGADSGFDSVGDYKQAQKLSIFLNSLDKDNSLPKTIIYNLNASDNDVIATLIGNFNDGSVKGKVQFGSGWWFNDQKDGIEKQLNSLSNQGLLSCFVGMLSDSRSLLSYARHEYFRRILCNLIAQDVQNGELPNDINHLGAIVQDICYNNAKNYFKFKNPINHVSHSSKSV